MVTDFIECRRNCARFLAERDAIRAINEEEDSKKAARILCAHADNLTLALSEEERYYVHY